MIATKKNLTACSEWRPINCVEQDYSLALFDARTLHEDDLVATDALFPHLCNEAYEF